MASIPLPTLPKDVERQLWADAYHISYVGASNPRAVTFTLSKWMKTLMQDYGYGTRQIEKHPALRNIAGQLAFLFGQSMGQTPADLEILAAKAKEYRLGMDDAT